MKSHLFFVGLLCMAMAFVAFDRMPTALSDNFANNQSLKILEQTEGYNFKVKPLITCSLSNVGLRLQVRAAVLANQTAPSADFLRQCLDENEETPFTLLDLGWLHWMKNEHNLARDIWSQLVSQEPLAFQFLIVVVGSDDVFYTLPDTAEVWQALTKVGEVAIQSAPEQSKLYLLMRQIYSDKLDNPLAGAGWLRQGLQNTGESWSFYWLLYGDTLALGDYAQAQIYLAKAWEFDEAYQLKPVEEYYGRYGSILLRQDQKTEAVYWLEHCLDVMPQNVSCLVELGEALYLSHSYEESLAAFSRVNLTLLRTERQQFVLKRIQEIEQILNPHS